MKAFQIASNSRSPAPVDVPVPEVKAGEVRLRVRACGLNFADLLLVNGTYQDQPEPPFTLGMEIAGEVEALGEDVDGLAIGERVAAFTGHGGLAEYAVAPANRCIPLPNAMTFDQAAAFQIAYGTSHLALDYKAHLKSGETLLVLGAAGGVGLTAVELGKRMGARVIACARGADKLRVAQEAGADHLIDSDTDDLKAALKELGGADVVYDPVGGDLFRAALSATRPDGRILLIGFASGTVPEIKPNHLLVKNVTVIGFWWGGYLNFAPDCLTDSLRTLFAWFDEGGLRPHISHTLPLNRAAEGLELLRSRQATGKVVVTP
ncbi:MAG: NADPH:quinone oxidoreductase family protein [Pseudomonadota bacterium]